jgi:hypothetical protein
MSDLSASYGLRSIFWPSKEKGLSVFLSVNHDQNITIRAEMAEQTSSRLLKKSHFRQESFLLVFV